MALDPSFKPVLRFMAVSDIHIKDDPDCVERARFAKAIQCAYRIAESSETYKTLDALYIVGDFANSGTEVQIAVVDGKSSVAAVFRNRSSRPLTLSGDALMERFVREDGARHTDGSGLGLSIAQSLMQLQGGKLWLHTEGDVFTAQILFRK